MMTSHPLLSSKEIESAQFFVDGAAITTKSRFSIIDPATGLAFGDCPASALGHVDAAVRAARSAFSTWAAMDMEARSGMLLEIAERMEGEKEFLARLLSAEQGKPFYSAALGEIDGAIKWMRATAALRPVVETVQDDDECLTKVYRRPLGVVASITPWNHPVMIAIWHFAPALLAGNTVVVKPSPYTPLATLKLVEMANEILPPGVLNSLTGGEEIGRALVTHRDVNKLIFTGSTHTGRSIMESAGPTLKRLTLELGGNDAAIILSDIDIDSVALRVFSKAFLNSGQTCAAIKRLYVHDSIYETFADSLAQIAAAAKVGPGHDPEAEFGPVQNKAQFEHVRRLAEDAAARGGRFLVGGAPLDRPGYFFPPTVVTDIKEGSALVDMEQFGPIIPLIRYTEAEDAIARANASDFGLGGSVWSSDIGEAQCLAARLDCGTVWVNDHATISPDAPFGGAKQSGLGVEFGLHGLDEYFQLHTRRIARR